MGKDPVAQSASLLPASSLAPADSLLPAPSQLLQCLWAPQSPWCPGHSRSGAGPAHPSRGSPCRAFSPSCVLCTSEVHPGAFLTRANCSHHHLVSPSPSTDVRENRCHAYSKNVLQIKSSSKHSLDSDKDWRRIGQAAQTWDGACPVFHFQKKARNLGVQVK